MADIIVTCPKCQSKTTVSEYISEKTVPCSSCGETIAMPEQKKQTVVGLTLRKKPKEADPPPEEQPTEEESKKRGPVIAATVKRKSALRDRDKRRVKAGVVVVAMSWAAFVLLGAGLFYVRFFSGIPGIEPEKLIQYGLIAVGVCYVLIILLALNDNMFDALLCIIVPMYPFYYIFMVSSLVYVRAIVGAILVTFGYDLALFLQATWEHVFKSVNYWIQTV
ncbi:hypothetical protein ACFLQR_02960 [Verrucomicrobiota bacterium]